MNPAVALCFDKGYANQASVAIFTCILNSSLPIKFYCIIPDSDISYMQPIHQIKDRFHLDIKIIPIDGSAFKNWNTCTHLSSNKHFSYVNYIRLLIPDLIEEDKVVYIDSDLLVLGDISELYATEMKDAPIGGIVDKYTGSEIDALKLNNRRSYINSGVLIFDCKKLRKNNFFKKCYEVYEASASSLSYVDQCLINKFFDGEQFLIDSNWNVQVRSDLFYDSFEKQFAKAKIIHFIGSTKPWHKWAMPDQKKYWWSYASLLKLKNFILVEPVNINQHLAYCRSLEIENNYKLSADLKSQIISVLLNKIEEYENRTGAF